MDQILPTAATGPLAASTPAAEGAATATAAPKGAVVFASVFATDVAAVPLPEAAAVPRAGDGSTVLPAWQAAALPFPVDIISAKHSVAGKPPPPDPSARIMPGGKHRTQADAVVCLAPLMAAQAVSADPLKPDDPDRVSDRPADPATSADVAGPSLAGVADHTALETLDLPSTPVVPPVATPVAPSPGVPVRRHDAAPAGVRHPVSGTAAPRGGPPVPLAAMPVAAAVISRPDGPPARPSGPVQTMAVSDPPAHIVRLPPVAQVQSRAVAAVPAPVAPVAPVVSTGAPVVAQPEVSAVSAPIMPAQETAEAQPTAPLAAKPGAALPPPVATPAPVRDMPGRDRSVRDPARAAAPAEPAAAPTPALRGPAPGPKADGVDLSDPDPVKDLTPEDPGPAADPLPRESIRSEGAPRLSPAQHAGHSAASIARQIAAAVPFKLHDRPVEISLDPAELGKVRLTLGSHDGVQTLMIAAERPETLDLMRRHVDLLADTFGKVGFSGLDLSFGAGTGTGTQARRDDVPPPSGAPVLSDTPVAPPPPHQVSLSLPALDRLDLRL